MTDLSGALLLTLRIALLASAFTALIGIPLAYLLARRNFPGKAIVETLLTLPLVLPPTVVGYILIILIGIHGPIGAFLYDAFGWRLIFSTAAAVTASCIVSLPLLLIPAKAAFAGVERELEEISRLMGASRLQTFWHVNLPLARRGVASGLLLAFVRSLGEFGATVMVFGSSFNRSTLSISIYNDFVAGEMRHALPAVLVLTGASLVVLLVYNRFAGRRD